MPIRTLSAVQDGKREPVRRESLIELIGRTPLVRLHTITTGLPAGVEVWAKLECLNPGGTNKDRTARQIILDAMQRGDLEDRRLIDATTGNIGVAYAMLGAALDVGVTLVIPEDTPDHLVSRITLFGADVVRSSAAEGIRGAILQAQKMAADRPDEFWFADQHSNPSNPRASASMADEIWEQTSGRVTDIVVGLGTSGSYVGTARAIQARNAAVRVYCCESVAGPQAVLGLRSLRAEAAPAIYDPTVGAGALQCTAEQAEATAVRLAAEEGIAAGWAAGGAVWAALEVARGLTAGVVVAVVGDHFDRRI